MNTSTTLLRLPAALLLGTTLALAGCNTTDTSHTQRRAAAGAVTGAILGGIIGHQSGDRDKGMLAGAALGAIVGGISGSEEDRRVEQARHNRQLAEETYTRERAELEARRQRLLAQGRSLDDPSLRAARERAEAAEAELVRLRQEEADAIRRAQQMAEYRAREEAAKAEIDRMRRG